VMPRGGRHRVEAPGPRSRDPDGVRLVYGSSFFPPRKIRQYTTRGTPVGPATSRMPAGNRSLRMRRRGAKRQSARKSMWRGESPGRTRARRSPLARCAVWSQ
jgi:hypothetical protein